MIIELPWPPRELNPNARKHWAVKAKAACAYKETCYYEARLTPDKTDFPKNGPITFALTFYPPDKRKRDDDNLVRMFKSGRDGIAEALNIDDSRFKMLVNVSDMIVPGGKVIVSISK